VEWRFHIPRNSTCNNNTNITKNILFFWALHVEIFIQSEGRSKSNELVLARPDISSVLLYKPAHPSSQIESQSVNPESQLIPSNLYDTSIVLVKEFRSSVSNESGYVYELPGGSSSEIQHTPIEIAVEEVEEETGITIDPRRFRFCGAKQLMATMSCHRGHLFAVELTQAELDKLRNQELEGEVHGIKEDTERTYVRVMTLRQILQQNAVDWSTLGMILFALSN